MPAGLPCIGYGALGFWASIDEIYPKTSHQRCWVHKTANALTKLPKAVQSKAKEALHEIWMAETREDASDLFDKTYEDKFRITGIYTVKFTVSESLLVENLILNSVIFR